MFTNGTNRNTSLKYFFGFRMLLKRGTGRGNAYVERENEKSEQGRVLQMNSLIGQGFNLNFAPIFLFPVPSARSQLYSLV